MAKTQPPVADDEIKTRATYVMDSFYTALRDKSAANLTQ